MSTRNPHSWGLALNWTTALFTLTTSFGVSVLSSYLTARFALRRFYSEKWWETKYAAYSTIIEAMHHLRDHADTNLRFAERGNELSPEGEEELTFALQDAMRQLRKSRDIGSFVLSSAAVAELNKLFTELDKATETRVWQEHLEMKLVAVDRCLDHLRDIARSDLRGKIQR